MNHAGGKSFVILDEYVALFNVAAAAKIGLTMRVFSCVFCQQLI
jgi:hypothetical protein